VTESFGQSVNLQTLCTLQQQTDHEIYQELCH